MRDTRKFGATKASIKFRYLYEPCNVGYDFHLLRHMQRNCSERVRNNRCRTQCFNCRSLGHISRGYQTLRTNNCCPSPRYKGLRKTCFNCQMLGHLFKDCVAPEKTTRKAMWCYHYGKMGHIHKDCNTLKNTNEVPLMNLGEEGRDKRHRCQANKGKD